MKTLFREIGPDDEVLYSGPSQQGFEEYIARTRKPYSADLYREGAAVVSIANYQDPTSQFYAYNEYEKSLVIEPLRAGFTLVGCDNSGWIFVKPKP